MQQDHGTQEHAAQLTEDERWAIDLRAAVRVAYKDHPGVIERAFADASTLVERVEILEEQLERGEQPEVTEKEEWVLNLRAAVRAAYGDHPGVIDRAFADADAPDRAGGAYRGTDGAGRGLRGRGCY